MDVSFKTRKKSKGATIAEPMHWAYLMGIWRNVLINHDEKKTDVNVLQYGLHQNIKKYITVGKPLKIYFI